MQINIQVPFENMVDKVTGDRRFGNSNRATTGRTIGS